MADATVAESNTSTQNGIDGAKVCIAALQTIEKIQEVYGKSEFCGYDGYFEMEKVAADFLVLASGVKSPYLVGFIATLSEYITCSNSAGVPDLNKWTPMAAMTEDEFSLYRKECEEPV